MNTNTTPDPAKPNTPPTPSRNVISPKEIYAILASRWAMHAELAARLDQKEREVREASSWWENMMRLTPYHQSSRPHHKMAQELERQMYAVRGAMFALGIKEDEEGVPITNLSTAATDERTRMQ